MERFSRIEALLGQEKAALLRGARVTVIGLGAVGSYAVEALARSGIGSLRLVDFDTVQITNINRQLFALESTIGEAKTAAALTRVRDINPACHAEAVTAFACAETLAEILSPAPDLVIDAIDSVNPKTALLQYAVEHAIPLLSSMGAALRTDPSCIRTGDIAQAKTCPLARIIRKRLRKRGIEGGIRCVYSDEPVVYDYASAEKDAAQRTDNRGRTRNILGSLPTITGIFGLVLANEAIHILTGKKQY